MQKIAPILAILIIAGLLGTNFAYADYTDWIGYRISNKVPNVCIFEAENVKVDFAKRDLFNKTVKWIKEGWVNKLNKATNSDDWNMTFEFIANATHFDKKQTDFPQCNVMIVYDAENLLEDRDMSSAQGFTSFDYSSSNHQWAYIDVFTWSPTNEIDLSTIDLTNVTKNADGSFEIPLTKSLFTYVPLTDEALRIVIQHEFGHAIGLGHYTETLTYEYNSIMLPAVNFKAKDNDLKSIVTTEDDIKAMIILYGKDGFDRTINPPLPDNPYGWLESVVKHNPLTGGIIIHFPKPMWLDPNFGLYQ